MKLWLSGLILGVFWMGCQSSSSEADSSYEATETYTSSGLPTADASPCEAIRKTLPDLPLPYTAKPATEAQETREPFPPYLQSWLLEKLPLEESEPVFTPIGQLRYSDYVLWLIEATTINGTFTYALFVDADCYIHDKLQVAGFRGTMRYMRVQSSTFYADGTFTLTDEYREIDLSVEPPHQEYAVKQVRYRVDPQRRRFLAL